MASASGIAKEFRIELPAKVKIKKSAVRARSFRAYTVFIQLMFFFLLKVVKPNVISRILEVISQAYIVHLCHHAFKSSLPLNFLQ